MKKIILGILVMFLIMMPLVYSLGDESLIKTNIKVKFDRHSENEAVIIIEGENLAWSKTIKYNNSKISNESSEIVGLPQSWIENLEILMIRTLGNYTDVQYAIMECNRMANFSNLWELCIEQRTDFELIIYNEMMNKTIYDEITGNLTIQRDDWKSKYENDKRDKDKEITNLTEERDKFKKHRNYALFLGVGGLIVGAWTLYKYRGFGKREHPVSRELPKDMSH